MPEGGTITLAAHKAHAPAELAGRLKPGEYICMSVTDTGHGMDEDTLARAVEPFFTMKGVGRGTGIGLSMVHGFAMQSEGALVLKSSTGAGTTAELWLPVTHDAAVRAPQDDTPSRAWNTPRLRVLVVDDDNLVLANTSAMLDDLGHEVLEATSGEQCLRLLRRLEDVDLVITDQLMPRMSGTELIAAIRSERPDLPIILATGYAEMTGLSPSNTQRLNKPFVQDQLAAAIAEAMRPGTVESRVLPFRQR